MVLGGAVDKAVCDAARFGDIMRLQQLIDDAGGRPDACNLDDHGWTALMFAASSGHLDLVSFLLERGASPDARSTFGHTALHVASARGHTECVELLLRFSRHVDVEATNGTPLALAVLKGHRKVAEILLAAGAQVRSVTVLRYAIESADRMILHWLLVCCPESHALVNEQDKQSRQRPLHIATMLGCSDSVSLLVQHGADLHQPDPSGRLPLCIAVARNDLATVQCLVAHGCEVDMMDCTFSQSTALHVAARLGHVAGIMVLLSAGGCINSRDAQSVTPLLQAINSGKMQATAVLIGENCDVDLQGIVDPSIGFRTTPLELAIRKGMDVVVNMLVAAGCRTDYLSPALLASMPWLPAKLQIVPSLMDICRLYIRGHFGSSISGHLKGHSLPPGIKFLLLMKDLYNDNDLDPDCEGQNDPYNMQSLRTSFDQRIYASVNP